jgi:hypothetical protein
VLSKTLCDFNWDVHFALWGDEVVALRAPGTKWLGPAVDIGTNKIARYFLDLEIGWEIRDPDDWR